MQDDRQLEEKVAQGRINSLRKAAWFVLVGISVVAITLGIIELSRGTGQGAISYFVGGILTGGVALGITKQVFPKKSKLI